MARAATAQAVLNELYELKTPAKEELPFLPTGVRFDLIKIIPLARRSLKDKAEQYRFIEILDGPHGQKRVPWTVRLYPDGNAPERVKRIAKSAASGAGASAPEPGGGKPTVEEMNTLLTMLHREEVELNQRLTAELKQRIGALKKELAAAEGSDEKRAFRELAAEMAKLDNLAATIREEAFKNVAASKTDVSRFLALLSRERPAPG